jgi:hypothetical protein
MLVALTVALAASLPTAARAESGLGWHGGFTLEPDQVTLGAQAVFPVGQERLYFVPQAEFGFFNGTAFSVHADLQARLGGADAGFRPYVAAGGTYYGFDPEDGDSDSKVGINLAGGFWTQKTSGKKRFAEVMFFLDDELPDFRLVIGQNF